MRFREQNPEDLDRARQAVRQWREQNPQGTPDEMVTDVGGEFHPDYAPVLRALLFRTDLRDAKVTTRIPIITGPAGASR